MTQAQINRAVSAATGDSLRNIRQHGFGLQTALEPEEIVLVLDCPFCGRRVPYPGPTGAGSPAIAECLDCDVEFDFQASEVYSTELLSGSTVASMSAA